MYVVPISISDEKALYQRRNTVISSSVILRTRPVPILALRLTVVAGLMLLKREHDFRDNVDMYVFAPEYI